MKPFSALVLSLMVLGSLPAIVPAAAIAHPPSSFQIAQRNRRRLSWRVGVRPSRYRIGGVSRSRACSNQAQVTAFVPPPQPNEQDPKNHGAIDNTVASHPTFWVHVANLPSKAQVQFTLQNAAGTEELYNTRFVLKDPTGLVGVRLPANAKGLKVGESYLWQLTVPCQSASADNLYIGSWIQRITPEQVKPTATFDPKPLVKAIATASDRDKPPLYAALGIWQDAVTMILEQRQKQPDNQELQEDWQSLLTGAQMSDFSKASILLVQ
jgi:Domain of Unknown Function (DUF928)